MPDFNDIFLKQGAIAIASAIDSAHPVEAAIPGDHLSLANVIISKIGRKNLIATSSHVWMWKSKGVWQPIIDREIKQVVQQYLAQMGHKVTRSLVDAVTDVLKSVILDTNHQWQGRTDIINVINGEIHWNGQAFILQPHKLENYSVTQIPIVFNPTASAPRFARFLFEIFASDVDWQEKATALLELIGYSLCSHTRFERFAILVGRGANGKSVVLELIRLLLGVTNVSAVQPSQFSNRFQRAHLHLKLANIVTEIAEGAEIADAELKAIVSGEGITCEDKHKPPFEIYPFCTIWIGTNHMPHSRDFSDALFRRALILPFNQTFTAGINADPLLKEKLAGELSGILNMALTAYAGVLQCGTFTEPESCKAAKREWRLQADQVAQFIEEVCELSPDGRLASASLYQSYNSWAHTSGITRRLNHKNFTQRLERLGYSNVKGAGGRREIAGIKQVNIPNYHNFQ